jgi:hypothetical protein
MCVRLEQVGHCERYDLQMMQYPQEITALYFKHWEGFPLALGQCGPAFVGT